MILETSPEAFLGVILRYTISGPLLKVDIELQYLS